MPQVQTPKITCTMPPKDIRWLDRTAKRFDISRSKLVVLCVDLARDDLKLLDSTGFKPERFTYFMASMEKLKGQIATVFRQGQLQMDDEILEKS